MSPRAKLGTPPQLLEGPPGAFLAEGLEKQHAEQSTLSLPDTILSTSVGSSGHDRGQLMCQEAE